MLLSHVQNFRPKWYCGAVRHVHNTFCGEGRVQKLLWRYGQQTNKEFMSAKFLLVCKLESCTKAACLFDVGSFPCPKDGNWLTGIWAG